MCFGMQGWIEPTQAEQRLMDKLSLANNKLNHIAMLADSKTCDHAGATNLLAAILSCATDETNQKY